MQPMQQQPQQAPNLQAAQQTQQGGPPQMAPQGNPPPAPTVAPQHGGKPSGRIGQDYNPQILAHIEQHLTQLPDQQKAFLVQYMTPELAIILGIIIGQEAYDYFNQQADPSKMLVVQPRPQPQQQTQGQPPAAPQNGQQPQAAAPAPAQSAPQPQPKANIAPKSIMGV